MTDKKIGPEELDWNYFSPLEIKVTNNFDRAFKAFKMLVQSEKILATLKEKSFYEKPSQKKRRKHNQSIRRTIEAEIKQKKILSGEYDKEKEKRQLKKHTRKLEQKTNER